MEWGETGMAEGREQAVAREVISQMIGNSN